MKIIVAAIVLVGLILGGVRGFVHQSNVIPAVLTPTMNARLEVSSGIAARVYRVAQDLPLEDRSDRPKLIALTFDDGPYPIFTPMLLDVLRDAHVPATFFLIGRDAEQWPEITHRIEAEECRFEARPFRLDDFPDEAGGEYSTCHFRERAVVRQLA